MPGDGFDQWNYKEFALYFFDEYTYNGYNEQNNIFYKIVKRIIAIVEKEYENKKLDKVGV